MYKSAITLLLFGWIPWSALAQPTGWKVDSYQVEFGIYNAGVWVDGTIVGLQYNISFSPHHLETSQLLASVQVNTIDTGIGARDRHLLQAEYFHAARWPTITLRSRALRALEGNQYEGEFSLTIRDVTRTLTLPFTFIQAGDTAVWKTTFTINREDYGIGEESLLMASEVEVNIQIEAHEK